MAKPKTPEKPSSGQQKFDLKATEEPVLPKPPEGSKKPVWWKVFGYPGFPTGRPYDSANEKFPDEKSEDKK